MEQPDNVAWVAQRLKEAEENKVDVTVLVVFHKGHLGFVQEVAKPDGPLVQVAFSAPMDYESISKLVPVALLHAFNMRAKDWDGLQELNESVKEWLRGLQRSLKRRLT